MNNNITTMTTSTPVPITLLKDIQQEPLKFQKYVSDTNDQPATISNPTNILSQQKSIISTNSFLDNSAKEKEIIEIQRIVKEDMDKRNQNVIPNTDIHKNISISCLGLLQDSLNKPDDIPWSLYIQIILKKDQRYYYIGILCLFMAFLILVLTQ